MFGGRTLPHISEEIIEVLPSGADANAAPTVILEAFYFGIAAARTHLTPARIFSAVALSGSMAMDRIRYCCRTSRGAGSIFFAKTATASGCFPLQTLGKNNSQGSTVAETEPHNRFTLDSSRPLCSETTEALSRYIFHSAMVSSRDNNVLGEALLFGER